jgi:hypothetical protein
MFYLKKAVKFFNLRNASLKVAVFLLHTVVLYGLLRGLSN